MYVLQVIVEVTGGIRDCCDGSVSIIGIDGFSTEFQVCVLYVVFD